MHILIVEDERRMARLLRQALQEERHNVDLAYDGHTGLDLAASATYDAIILDLMLPGLDGLTICRQLRTEAITTPVLMLTARGAVEDRVTGLNTGADDYLTKPFAIEEFLARIDAGRLLMEHDIINLADVVTAVTRRAKVLIDQAQLTLIAEDFAPTLVIGDRTLLEQAAMILLDNAIKYNQPGGSITIRTFIEKQQVRLEVCDTGIGIAPEHLPYVGERFYRVDRARSSENGGCGLGIAIARGIIVAHGGTLTLSSTVGQGTRVTLNLDPAFPA